MTREMVTAARRLLLARTLSQLSPTFHRPGAQAPDISSLHRPLVSMNLWNKCLIDEGDSSKPDINVDEITYLRLGYINSLSDGINMGNITDNNCIVNTNKVKWISDGAGTGKNSNNFSETGPR